MIMLINNPTSMEGFQLWQFEYLDIGRVFTTF